MLKTPILILLLLLGMASCRKMDTIGFYNPVTFKVAVPDGPPEYKAGWYGGCKSGMGVGSFANAFVFKENRGPEFDKGVYQHDPMFQTGWGQGWFACATYGATFTAYHPTQFSPLGK